MKKNRRNKYRNKSYYLWAHFTSIFCLYAGWNTYEKRINNCTQFANFPMFTLRESASAKIEMLSSPGFIRRQRYSDAGDGCGDNNSEYCLVWVRWLIHQYSSNHSTAPIIDWAEMLVSPWVTWLSSDDHGDAWRGTDCESEYCVSLVIVMVIWW